MSGTVPFSSLSTILMAFMRGDQIAVEKVGSLVKVGARLTTTVINAYELYHGAYSSRKQSENLIAIRELLAMMELLQFDEKSCDIAGKIVSELEASGSPIGVLDSLIAGITLRHEETLVTRNLNHFGRVTSLNIEPW